MVNEINYINLRIIADRLTRHPLMIDLTFEAIIQYTIDFIGTLGLPPIYLDKVVTVDIDNYRAALPCDLIAIRQVKDVKNNISLRATTDTFHLIHDEKKPIMRQEGTFKTQGNIIYTSFKEGKIAIAYRAIPVDEEGLPMIPDNSIFLKALELYIKKEWFTIQFDMGKIAPAVLQNVQQEYAWKVGQLNTEFILPSVSEMEAISNMMNQLLPRTNEFRKGFKPLGNREYWKDQR
jgi:hypothetical protein